MLLNDYSLASQAVNKILRAIFWEYRESKDTHEKSNFFLFCQKIPLGKLIQEKIIQSSNELFNGRKFKKFEKCIKWRF